ncbi:MAG TPA: glycosyltransferase family 4 protein [Gemmatimonadales bacterium]|nr:glycosyltransferase family 4 protein [Gemmatimonadales bacterium]
MTNRTYHVALELQREFDVAMLAFSRRNHQPDAAARSAARDALARELTQVLEPVPIGSERSTGRKLLTHAASFISGRPYLYYEYADSAFARQLEAALGQRRPDIVHLDSMDLYRWLPALPSVPVTCTHHSIESDLLRLRADQIRSPWARRYLRLQANRIERLERALTHRFAVNVMMSELDAERLRALNPRAKTVVVPNGVNTEHFRPSAAAPVEGRVAFLGPTYMFPNRDAVDFFLGEVWERVRGAVPHASLHLIGKNSPEDRARFTSHPAVTCNGYVPDIRPHFADAACSIVPIRVGGGTRLKILDAWAMGKAVVSTTVGCEGLTARDGENILIRDDPAAFADAVVRVLTEPDLRHRLELNARRTAEECFAWRIVGRVLRDSYRRLIAS